jgi:hypothetical protein
MKITGCFHLRQTLQTPATARERTSTVRLPDTTPSLTSFWLPLTYHSSCSCALSRALLGPSRAWSPPPVRVLAATFVRCLVVDDSLFTPTALLATPRLVSILQDHQLVHAIIINYPVSPLSSQIRDILTLALSGTLCSLALWPPHPGSRRS